jgi:hypothetical protein
MHQILMGSSKAGAPIPKFVGALGRPDKSHGGSASHRDH